MEIKKPDKKSLQYLGVIIIIAIIVCIGLFYYLKYTEIEERQEEESIQEGISEEILKQFRAPNKEGIEIPEHELEQFGAPDEGKEISEDILEQFRAQ